MVKPTKRVLYVEGGGNHNSSLASECRKAFAKLLENADIEHKPRVVACGGRKRAYDQFCTAHAAANSVVWISARTTAPRTTRACVRRCWDRTHRGRRRGSRP
jgi:hypothetical protein